jgi:hypothetical protein
MGDCASVRKSDDPDTPIQDDDALLWRERPLASLQFDMPAGIARFELSAIDPDIETDIRGGTTTLSAAQLNSLEVALDCKLTQIEARF